MDVLLFQEEQERFGMSPANAIAKPSAASWLRLLIVLGLMSALVIAATVAAMETFKASRKCHGAFSRGFSAGFDIYRCDLIIRIVPSGTQITIPLP
jgi:hypothetical protein